MTKIINTYKIIEQFVLYYMAAMWLKYQSGTKNQFVLEQ